MVSQYLTSTAPGGRGVLNKVLSGEAQPQGPTSYPFAYI